MLQHNLHMTMRMTSPVVRRPSLPLTANDEAELVRLREEPQYRQALQQLSGAPVGEGSTTEAALLHAIFAAGLTAVKESAEEAGYAVMAAEQDAQRQMEARRRGPTWADEE